MRFLAKTVRFLSPTRALRCAGVVVLAIAVAFSGLSFSVAFCECVDCECSSSGCCSTTVSDSCCSGTSCCGSSSNEASCCESETDSALACCGCECCSQLTVAAKPTNIATLLAKVHATNFTAAFSEILPPQIGGSTAIDASADCQISSARIHVLHSVWLI